MKKLYNIFFNTLEKKNIINNREEFTCNGFSLRDFIIHLADKADEQNIAYTKQLNSHVIFDVDILFEGKYAHAAFLYNENDTYFKLEKIAPMYVDNTRLIVLS